MAELEIRAGEKLKVASRFSSSIPEVIRFQAEPKEPGGALKETVEIRSSAWLFPKQPVQQPLQTENEIHKGAWDTLFSVWVEAETDLRILTKGSQYTRYFRILIILGILALILAVALIAGALMN